MLRLSVPRRLTMSSCLLEKLPMLALNQPTRWLNVIPEEESSWLAVCSTGVMLSQKTSMLQLPPSRPREPSSLLIGVQQDSRSESTISLQQLFLELTWPRSREPSVCSPTPLPLPKPGQDLTTSLILCMPRELLFIGMSEREWRKESSLRPERILLL